MVQTIEKLTPEQEAQMKPWADQWIQNGLRCDRVDPEQAKKYILECYAHANKEDPYAFVMVSSPMVLGLAASASAYILEQLEENVDAFEKIIPSKFPAILSELALLEFMKQEGVFEPLNTIHCATKMAVLNAFLLKAGHLGIPSLFNPFDYEDLKVRIKLETIRAVCEATAPTLVGQMEYALETLHSPAESTEDLIVDAILAYDTLAISKETRESKASFGWSNVIGGNMWSSWSAFTSFFVEVCGLELPSGKKEAELSYRTLSKNSGWWWPHSHFVIACDFPEAIHLDNQALHCEDDYAIKWRDGFGICSWRGNVVPDAWIVGQKPTAAELLQVSDIEQRRCGFEIIGWDALLNELESTIVDEHEDPMVGTLYEANVPDVGRSRFLKVRCATGRDFVLPVEDNCPSALAAQASLRDIPVEEFKLPEVRT